ncbi:hypothetical protein D9611_008087 [Ephemerocybe angulata]|uniref:Uncharacterized protein n=2 Tax=Ephemerocybe angulata TaxID=980116 RepID=A0A8H6I8V0_9AGAR|nr:hypothetical protein D9611_008087 [Tulosesus angulatus]KAF6759451.1 hypothetical protein DFP72DRAFT_1063824 [Tulosesus angulatus]
MSAKRQETGLIEIDRAPGRKVEGSYIVQLGDNVDMRAFMQRFQKACPPGLRAHVKLRFPEIKKFTGVFGDETLLWLRSAPEVDGISENALFRVYGPL